MLALTPFHWTFLAIAGPALGLALPVILIATWRFPFRVQCIAVLFGIAVLWAGIFLGTHFGYGAWQTMPDPPEEAFADGAQLTGSLLLGWLPAGMIACAWWGGLSLIGPVMRRRRGSQPAPEPSS